MSNTLSLKERFSGFASSYIVDKRGLGYHSTDLTKRLSYDPEYLAALAEWYLTKAIAPVDDVVWAEIFRNTCDTRGDFIRGNSAPVEIMLVSLWTQVVSALQNPGGFSQDEAELLAPIVINCLRQTGLYAVSNGEIISVFSEIDNTIHPLLGHIGENFIFGRVVLASRFAVALDKLHKDIKAREADLKDRRSWLVSTQAQVLSLQWKLMVADLLVAKATIVEQVKALNTVARWALRNDTFNPLHLTKEELSYLFGFANTTLGTITTKSAVATGAPDLALEVRAKQAIEALRRALGSSSCLYEIRPTAELCKFLSQYEVLTSGETPVRRLHATEWYYPRSFTVNAAYRPSFVPGTTIYFISPSSQAAQPVSQLVSQLGAVCKTMDEKWFRTSHSQIIGGEVFINYLTATLCPYSPNFSANLLFALAAFMSRSVRYVDTQFVFEVNGWDDFEIAPAGGHEQRSIFETDPARAICQTAIGGEGTMTAFKNASIFSMCPANSLNSIPQSVAVPTTFVGIPLNNAGTRPMLLAAPAAHASIKTLDDTPLDVNLPLYAWLGLPEDMAVEVYIERTLTCEMADGMLGQQLAQLQNVPISGPNSSYHARSLKLHLFHMFADMASKNCGSLIQQLQANYAGWTPSPMFEQGATQAARMRHLEGTLEMFCALLKATGFYCAGSVESFLNHCIDTFTVDELLNKAGI